MKKRLLISSVLMSAVLACALGTGTYAWYQASSGTMATASDSVTVNTMKDEQIKVGSITFTLTIDNDAAPDLVDENGKTYYYKAASGNEVIEDGENDKFGVLTIGATTSASSDELATIVGAYALTISYTSSSSNVAKLSNDETPYKTGGENANLYLVVYNNAGTYTHKICSDKDGNTPDTTINYSIMGKTDGTRETAPTVEFTVTLSTEKES